MADHARMQVRAAAVSDLTGLSLTGSRVFNARVKPIKDAECPCLNVFLLDEAAEWDATGTMMRTGDLVVEGRVVGGDDLFDDLDAVAAQVETAIFGETPALAGLLKMMGPPRTQIELHDPAQGAERRHGTVRILFPVQYRTSATDPTQIL